jgi:F-type H+-transporting ATPase subunit alpha
VVDLTKEEVGAIVLGDYLKIKLGDRAVALGKILSIPVSTKLLGRIVDPLVNPLDGKEKIKEEKFYPIEKIAPGVIYRKPVSVPVQTGIKAIDALIPIGRGQRELIIGDRGTGKTTLATDTILNQKNEKLICIYCAIGQRNAKVAQVIDFWRKKGQWHTQLLFLPRPHHHHRSVSCSLCGNGYFRVFYGFGKRCFGDF